MLYAVFSCIFCRLYRILSKFCAEMKKYQRRPLIFPYTYREAILNLKPAFNAAFYNTNFLPFLFDDSQQTKVHFREYKL